MENFSQFTPFLLMIAVIYFFMIAPQMRKAKKERKFLTDLKKVEVFSQENLKKEQKLEKKN